MKVLILCGVFAEENEAEVMAAARRAVEFSANVTQKKLIDGFRATENEVRVLSAPFLGAYPNASSTVYFRGFSDPSDLCEYVRFCNVWGIRNPSRAHSLKRAIRSFCAEADPEKLIVVYCPHTPFLQAAAYAKKLSPECRICLYVPDLPEYMNLSEHVSLLYRVAKFFDIRAMHRAMRSVDSFVLLTRRMKERLPVSEKPYLVCEGLVERAECAPADREREKKTVVYTGKLSASFGVKSLLDCMEHLTDPELRLVLCGTGELLAYAKECAERDARITVLGQVSPTEAHAWQARAQVLVNPRGCGGEYTKYSFPSKNVEYLMSGAAVVAYLLPGMPQEYHSFCYCVEASSEEDAPCALAFAIERALQADESELRVRHENFVRYAEEHLLARRVAEKIKKLCK